MHTHTPFGCPTQQDVALRELQEFGQSMVQRVGNLVTKHPELEPTLQLLFSQVSFINSHVHLEVFLIQNAK